MKVYAVEDTVIMIKLNWDFFFSKRLGTFARAINNKAPSWQASHCSPAF